MKKWMQKLVSQLEVSKSATGASNFDSSLASEELGTVIHMLDTYSKLAFDIENKDVRKTREEFDLLLRQLVNGQPQQLNDSLFSVRQFFNSYRIEETRYVQKSFDDFRSIVWSLVDQLSEDLRDDRKEDQELGDCLEKLREAVEANDVPDIKTESLNFISKYTQIHAGRQKRKNKRAENVKKNLNSVKKQLLEANDNLHRDHLSGAHNRKSFDEQLKQASNLSQMSDTPCSLLLIDIDHFKKINDSYGHDIGDFVIQECVRVLQEVFDDEGAIVARVGGEEFAVLLPNTNLDQTCFKAHRALERFRKESYVKEDMKLTFTVSMGVSQISQNETVDHWYKRTDQALYASKHNGRNQITQAPKQLIRTVA